MTKKVMEENQSTSLPMTCWSITGRIYGGKALGDRKRLLTELLQTKEAPHLHQSVPLPVESFEDLATLRENSRQEGAEGLVIKSPGQPLPGGPQAGLLVEV